ncbi:type III-B CRISPR-associated protein Cas10/Cmr2 [Desulforhopalus vacuolatus]|uniref:type III-B CRISPR-associated protein Cas10/Cmr2 n=1 Tax=Desulforhopalus vacuolatus TaxID=40414 RepID=UPI0019624BE7|nr:type III-B CRISPR-associated protein Cas10/Cmr2 [Desulforhopalus vacuolatus]MBM9520414.1 type III-B CRISPR-associated protein Cas10/Cmr2 [Desulforhopalus vacuolatus]
MREKQQYLLSISVGPVQEFIASARKLRDLWYGSWLLSELSKAVAKYLSDAGCDLIFPGIEDKGKLEPKSELNTANKILARTGEVNEGEIRSLVEEARKAFDDCWKSMARSALNAIPRKDQQNINRELFEKQLDDFGEFFAAWTPLKDNYSDSLERCERLLAGRKALREFSAAPWNGAGIPKSSLDGIRESVLRGDQSQSYLFKKGEHLDAMGLIKRFGPVREDSPHFDNFAQLAVEPLLDRLAELAVSDPSTAAIISSLPSAERLYPFGGAPVKSPQKKQKLPLSENFPTELLLPLSFAEESGQHRDNVEGVVWERLKRDIQQLHRKAGEPGPYVCLLVGDGDNMGQTLSKMKEVNHHRQFSVELDRFAGEVRNVFAQFSGKVVYSGGDDVMGYTPLHTMLSCAEEINRSFHKVMKAACAGTEIKSPPTFSLGVAIVHVKNPMDQSFLLARQAETLAKQQGRNRLAIIQSKRNGSDIQLCGLWRVENTLKPFVTRMNEWVQRYRNGALSSRLAYQLRALVAECGDELRWKCGEADNCYPDSPAALEAIRLICHKDFESSSLTAQGAAELLSGHTSLYHLASELVVAHQLAGAELCGIEKGES